MFVSIWVWTTQNRLWRRGKNLPEAAVVARGLAMISSTTRLLRRRWNLPQQLHHPHGGLSTTQVLLLRPSHNIQNHRYFSMDAGGDIGEGRGEIGVNSRERRGGPPPIRVSMTGSSSGRGVFATRRICAGELVHTANPLFTHPSPYLTTPVCYYCLRRLVLEDGGCGTGNGISEENSSTGSVYRFCSTSCLEKSKAFLGVEKRANWLEYEDYCKTQKLKYPLMVKRVACMIISGTTSFDAINILQPDILPAEVISLHIQMEDEFQLLKSTLSKADIGDESMRYLTKNWYVGVLARIRINAFRIELVGGRYEDLLANAIASVGTDGSVGNAIYMLPSFYNHDCDPNMHIIWVDNADAQLKALRDIEKDEELRICYIDASMDKKARQELLLQGFGFRCHCHRCISDY